MAERQKYTKAELKKLYTNLKRRGITDQMANILIEHCYNHPVNLRTSGFFYAGAPDAEIDWDNSTRTFSITPFVPEGEVYAPDGTLYEPHFSFYSWNREPKIHHRYEEQTVQLPNEEGLFLIHFDVAVGDNRHTLQYLKNPENDEIANVYVTGIPVAWLYYNATTGTAIYFGDSRHGSEWNPQIHWSWHQTLNSVRQEGIAIVDATYDGDGSENAHYQFGISEGKLWHEDILDSVEAVGLTDSLPVWYFDASGLPRYSTQSGKKFLNTGSGRVAFNPPAGGLAEATTDYYVLYHLFATNCIYQEIISVMGQAQYQQLGQAIAAINAEVADLRQQMPHSNMMWIDTIIIQTSDDYTNDALARIVTNACTVMTEMSVTGDGSPLNKIKLVGDEETPGDLHFYGTGDEFEPDKGFHHLYAKLVNQPAHGFSEKQAIRHNGTQFVLAQADSAENAQTAGIVVEVIDADNFRYQSEGFYAHDDWVEGTEYFLSPDTAGLVTTEPAWAYPDDAGKVRQHLGYGTDRGLKIEIDVGDVIGATTSNHYKWYLHEKTGETTAGISEPENVQVAVNGSGSVDQSYPAGFVQVWAVNENGNTLPVDVPAFDLLTDSTEITVSWNAVTGATGYIVNSVTMDAHWPVSGTSVDIYGTFPSGPAIPVPTENTTGGSSSGGFKISNDDVVDVVGDGIDIEFSEDAEDSTKKIITLTNLFDISSEPTTITPITDNTDDGESHTHKLEPAGSQGEVQFNSLNRLASSDKLTFSDGGRTLSVKTTIRLQEEGEQGPKLGFYNLSGTIIGSLIYTDYGANLSSFHDGILSLGGWKRIYTGGGDSTYVFFKIRDNGSTPNPNIFSVRKSDNTELFSVMEDTSIRLWTMPFYSISQGTGDNDKLVTQGYVDEGDSSDKRLKKSIKPIKSALLIIKKLKGIRFKWRKTKKESIGFIAQDFEKVMPELVSENSAGFKRVDYRKVTALLVEGMKEMNEKIQRLETEIEKLKQ